MRQSAGAQDSTSSTTGLWKITVLPLHYHRNLEASKFGITDSNETLLEGAATKCNIFGSEWLGNTESK